MVGQAQTASEGNASGAPAPRRTMGWLALAAAILVLAGLGVWWQRESQRVPFAAVAPRLIEFFATQPLLDKPPQDKAELETLMASRGAPSGFHIPASLLPLESAACQVVPVQDRSVWLMCFWRSQKPDRGMPELVHLLVSKPDDFRETPPNAQPLLRAIGEWNFASWRESDILYTLAAAAPLETLQPFIARETEKRNTPTVRQVFATR